MKTKQPYEQTVLQAERAVSKIKDPELRVIAFRCVLRDMLTESCRLLPRKEVRPIKLR